MADVEPNDALRTAVARLQTGGRDSRLWIDKLSGVSTGVAHQADSLVEMTRRLLLTARRTGRAIPRRNCVGVFGPSQAGKSYLVSAFARRPNKPLEIDFSGEIKDFLQEINPAGDRESTGLVSRFTRHEPAPDPDYPVELRLLSETDIVKIIANSFLSDFDPNNMSIAVPDEVTIRDTIRAIEVEPPRSAPAVAHLDEIELFDLGEYFRRHFKNRIGAHDRADYWNALIRLAGRLPIARRARLFAMLWGDLEPFTALFITLAGALERIGNPPEARAALSGLVPREIGDPPHPNTIIDVAVLNRLNSAADAADPVGLKPIFPDGPGQPTTLPRALLTALIAEVKLVMVDAPWPFYEHTDLLDFPGARSRLKLTHLPEDPAEGAQQIRELFLRGKIAFLFQRFTDELELTAMLLCMPPSVQEVKDLAGMVRSWIDTTHGRTPELRGDRTGNALFLVLTKFDLEFLEKGGETQESRRGKWDRRLHSSFLELYGKDGWPADWDGRPFSNTVFLRNPGMKQIHLMDYADSGDPVEIGPAGKAAAVIEGYRDAFLHSALVEKHFQDRIGVWEAALRPNDGGVAYLVGRLSVVLDPGLKQRQALGRLEDAAAGLRGALDHFYHREGEAAQRARGEHLKTVRKTLYKAVKMQEYRSFAHFIDTLLLAVVDVRNLFLNVVAMREEDLRVEPDVGDPVDEGADDPWADATGADDSRAVAPAAARTRERPEVFADRVINAWTGQLRRLPQTPEVLRVLELPDDIIGAMVDELIVGADRHGLRDRIAAAVREETLAVGARWEEAADRAVRIAVYEINDYVSYLGFGWMSETERPRHRGHAIFSPEALHVKGIDIGRTREPLEENFFLDWGVALLELGMDNISHASGREISDEHNQELGLIMAHLKVEDTLRGLE